MLGIGLILIFIVQILQRKDQIIIVSETKSWIGGRGQYNAQVPSVYRKVQTDILKEIRSSSIPMPPTLHSGTQARASFKSFHEQNLV